MQVNAEGQQRLTELTAEMIQRPLLFHRAETGHKHLDSTRRLVRGRVSALDGDSEGLRNLSPLA